MRLALRGARTNRRPADEVREVGGEVTVQQLGGDRQVSLRDLRHQVPRHQEPVRHVTATIQVWITNQPLPTHAAPWLFQIDPHDDQKLGAMSLRDRGQTRGVVERRPWIVNRAGPHDDQEPVTVSAHQLDGLQPVGFDGSRGPG
jgi:hypothetical protein